MIRAVSFRLKRSGIDINYSIDMLLGDSYLIIRSENRWLIVNITRNAHAGKGWQGMENLGAARVSRMGRRKIERRVVQVRLTPEDHAELVAANGSETGAAAEIMRRLEEYRSGGVERAVGDLAAFIAARSDYALYTIFGDAEQMPPKITRKDAEETRRAELLATIREAMVKVLDDLGAADWKAPNSDQMTGPEMVTGITWDIVMRIKAPKDKDDTPEGRTLARIGKTLFGELKNQEPRKPPVAREGVEYE
jgi:hypothetical protein